MLGFMFRGFSLALSAISIPGPLQAFLVSATLAAGWQKVIVSSLAPLIADIPLIILVVFVFRSVPPEFIRVLQTIGGLFLLWLAYGGWQQWRRGEVIGTANSTTPVESTRIAILRKTVLINILSPGPYIFWATVNGPLLVQGLSQSVWHGLAFLAGFYVPFCGLLAVLVYVFGRLRSLNQRIMRAIMLITVIILCLFGLSLIGQGIGGV